MSAEARLTVRIMDRTRSVDEFEMAAMSYDPGVIVLEAAEFAERLASRMTDRPDAGRMVKTAMSLAYDQVVDDGFTVRTRIMDDGWLLLVRIDRRTGPAQIHRAQTVPMRMAA